MASQKKHPHLEQFSLVHKLDFAEFYLDNSHQVMMVKYLNDVVVDLERGKQVVETVYPYIVEGAILGMTDATSKNINITAETRDFYSSNKSMNNTVIHIVVVKELYVRILAKLFISFNKPTIPTKIFNDFHKAYDFLARNYINSNNRSQKKSIEKLSSIN